ncbi:hypothetical protein Lfu02_43250 [Longispora fulva]|uniref:Uncharacterized protein n=1 Tax=Longispora fulva TaxID=619741 RepID=A0A8J7KPW9_9ACTN|nr:hypothetical protein [Longispora fulva]MBG6136782.1 hypothetical protein [Longispora fulva]GIG59953.1 hypothetical protein Lfu02_43250 [Longispora fulva]
MCTLIGVLPAFAIGVTVLGWPAEMWRPDPFWAGLVGIGRPPAVLALVQALAALAVAAFPRPAGRARGPALP